ncbi:MAG: hypothetical protein IJK34_00555 [Clostridia bacterium]|nr:hypothetical protein [Clostridia bacterium]
MTRTEFLKEQTLSAANKCRRTPMPYVSFANEPVSIAERKALGLKWIFDNMPVYIGPKELIVGTRTFFAPLKGNEDGHDIFMYSLYNPVKYINEQDIALFGCDQSHLNKTHYCPDLGIMLEKGIDGIIKSAEEKEKDPSLKPINREFLESVKIAYTGLKNLILRYADEAEELAKKAERSEDKAELETISRICKKISGEKPETFHEAVQLLWFTHLGTIIESFQFINYGRLDVILGKFLKDTPKEEAQQLIDCLLLKMYDQVDVLDSYYGKYNAQLVVTLGGVLPDGENAVNPVTMMFLDAIGRIRLPEPEFNLRINSKNPPEFLEKASELTINGCNFVSYYNDDLFIKSLTNAGIAEEYARNYGFDLCQDMNIPGFGDFWLVAQTSLISVLLSTIEKNCDAETFDVFTDIYKSELASAIKNSVDRFNAAQKQVLTYGAGNADEYFDGVKNRNLPRDRGGNSPMAPLPYLSALFHGCIENASDVIYEPYPIKEKGFIFGTSTEAVNSLAAIKKIVFEEKKYTLKEVYDACKENFAGDEGEIMRNLLWNSPKWGNDNDYVDLIAKDIFEFCLSECEKYTTYAGGRVLGGIHQPHPVATGSGLMATPEGRRKGEAVAVSLTPENGTMKNGPTSALKSASKIEPMLVQWNFCVMVNYFASVFKGNNGAEVFRKLLRGYFNNGGMQHQPNVLDVESLKKAQTEPEKYKDLIVRMWGVSAHFVDLPKAIQDEMIARFSY